MVYHDDEHDDDLGGLSALAPEDGAHDDEDGTQDAADDAQDAQDDADDEDGADTHPDDEDGHRDPTEAAAADPEQAWLIVMNERDEDGDWRPVGQPLPDMQFSDMGTAFDMVARLNRRDFGHKFDWLRNPKRGWIAVKAEACRN